MFFANRIWLARWAAAIRGADKPFELPPKSGMDGEKPPAVRPTIGGFNVTGVPKVRNLAVKLVLIDLNRAGIPTEPLLREAGLQPQTLDQDEGWVSYLGCARLLESAAKALNDPFYGINLARALNPRDHGAIAYVGLSSRTLEDALRNLERYLRVLTEAWTIRLSLDAQTAVVERIPARDAFHDYPQAVELGTAALIFGYQFFLKDPLAPSAVRFVHGRSVNKSLDRYRKLLGCPVEFNTSHCQVVLDRRLLARMIGTADDKLLGILKTHCEKVLEEQGPIQSDLVTRIRQTIVDSLSAGKVRAGHVADRLGMTERTMHRRLAEELTSFTDIHESLCRGLALKYIREEKLNLKKIAFLLGYADQSACVSACNFDPLGG
jgi:AraC-like DNA-binding protein